MNSFSQPHSAPSAAAAAAMRMRHRPPRSAPPSVPQQTLYIRNLCETMSKKKIESILKALFEDDGIIAIHVKRNVRHRGQAFVTFKDMDAAIRAKTLSDGFPLFGRPMDIQFSKEPAFKVSILNGTIDEHIQRRKEIVEERKHMEATTSKIKKRKFGESDENLPPNHILFVQNLPDDITEEALVALFKPFQGFKEVRLVPSRSDIAFVEYENEIQSAIARQSLHRYQISPEHDMRVSFAKKS